MHLPYTTTARGSGEMMMTPRVRSFSVLILLSITVIFPRCLLYSLLFCKPRTSGFVLKVLKPLHLEFILCSIY